MKFAVLGLMVVFLAVLFALFYVSFKMLKKVRQQERSENAGKVPVRRQVTGRTRTKTPARTGKTK